MPFYYGIRIQWWEEAMKLKDIGYAALIAATAVMFVLGSAGIGEAKARKKAAAPAPMPQPTCMLTADSSVCAVKGGMKFTYLNACYAANDGAKEIKAGACKSAKKAMKGGKKKAKAKGKAKSKAK